MASVGEQLRSARIAQGREVAELSARTKIGRRFLEAIEADDRKQLPAGFFYRSWVRQYAEALSLDSPTLLAEVDRTRSGESPLPLPGQAPPSMQDANMTPVLLSSGRRAWTPSVLSLAFVVGLGSVVYAWWRTSGHGSAAAVPGAIPKVPEVSRTAVMVPASKPDLKPPDVKPPETLPPPEPPIGDANGEVRLELTATAPTWVSIAPDGKQAFSGVLLTAQVKNVAARAGALIRVGNAGALQVRVNGKTIGPVGPNGQVRTLKVSKDGYQISGDKPAAPLTDEPQL